MWKPPNPQALKSPNSQLSNMKQLKQAAENLWFNSILGSNFLFCCSVGNKRKENLNQGQNWTTTYTLIVVLVLWMSPFCLQWKLKINTADSGWAFNDVSYRVRYHGWLVALRGKLSDSARRRMIAFCRRKGALKNVNILTVSRAVALISQENLYPLT